MRSAIAILSLVGAIVAEAPYHLPRPAAHAPAFNYQAPAPLPVLRPQPPPVHHHHHHHPAPQPNFVQGSGYHYQQPSIQPAYVQPQPQYQPAQLPRYQPQPQPLPTYYAPAPAPIPAPQPAPQVINYPSTSYGVPQAPISRPIVSQPLPNYVPVQQQISYVQPQPQPAPAPINYYQNQQYSGYAYSQPATQSVQASFPQQSQFQSTGVSSYQADSNLYNNAQAQTHSEALDSLVVSHVQNIIKDNEHSTAKEAGYLSLVSGVSLENVKPSVEISSFVHSAPINSGVSSSVSTSSDAITVSAPSSDYGLPTITANSQSSQGLLPAAKPVSTYGVPN